MKNLWIQGVVVSIFAVSAYAADSEKEYFLHSSRASDWTQLGYRYISLQKDLAGMKDPMQYYRTFARMYPGTYEAGLAEEKILNYIYQKGTEEEFLTEAEKMLDRPLEQGRVLAVDRLTRFATDQAHPADLRKRAANLALTHCEGSGDVLRTLWRPYIKGKMKWEQLLTYAKIAGKGEPDAMDVLHYLLDATPAKRKDFAELYGEQLLPPVPADLVREIKECNYLAEDARDYAEDKDYDNALATLLKMKQFSPWSSAKALQTFTGSIRTMPDDLARKFTEAVFEFALPGEIFKSWMNIAVLERKSSFEKENYEATSRILKLYGMRGVGKSRLMFTFSFMCSRKYDNYPLMAEIAMARGLTGEYAGGLLFAAAIKVWDTDSEKADFYLNETLRLAPGTPSAAKARWWMDRRSGKVSLNAGAAPRAPEYLKDVPAAPVSNVNVQTGSETEIAALAEAWVPASLPESKVFVFDTPKTLSGANIEMEQGVNFTLEMLDRDGKVLRVAERVWPLSLIDRHLYQPDAKQDIRFLPVDDVASVRITVLSRNLEQDGIHSLKFQTTRYPLRKLQRGQEMKIPAGSTCFETVLTAKEPEKEIKTSSGCENWRVTPCCRWYNPWASHNNRFGNTNVFFYGCGNAGLDIAQGGTFHYSLDGKADQFAKEANAEETHDVKAGSGFHRLNTFTTHLPELLQDTHTPDLARLRRVTVKGKAQAIPGAEFFVKGKWMPFVAGKQLAIPKGATKVRSCILFDSSSVNGAETAVVTDCKTSFSKNKGKPGTTPDSLFASVPADASAEAVKFLQKNRPAVVYPKSGTPAEYEAAKALAERAGCYLVSDDVALNNEGYRGPFLVLGSPLNNRLLRQAAAKLGLFFSPEFLNSKDGMIFQVPEQGKEEMFYAVSGMTPEAVVKAANRLKSKTAKFQAKAPFRLFEQHLMTRLMPWQMHPEKPELAKLSLTIARNERRNIAFGLVLEKDASAADVKVTLSEKLPPLQVRFTGFHEYINFYGDLHQPDLLFSTMRMPEKAYTSHLVLLTCRIPKNTEPGTYAGKVTVTVDGKTKEIPLEIKVVPGTIPDTELQFNDYAAMPYYYHDTERMRKDRRNLIRDQVQHGISMQRISFPLRFKQDGKADFTLLEEYVTETDAIYREEGKPLPYYTFGLPDYELRMYASKEKKVYEDCAKKYAEELKAYLKEHPDLDKRLYCSLGDEILGILDRWLKEAQIYKDAGLKIYVTHADPRMAEVVAAWCPNYAHKLFDQPYLAKALKEGKQRVWWYICAGGGPNTRFTGDPVDAYPVYLLTVKWGVHGASNNAALYFPSGTNPVPYRFDHGSDTRVFFLPSGELCDTLRREFEAEGIQDALLLYPLRDNPEIQTMLKKVVPSKWQYSRDPADYDALRDKAHSLLK